MIEPSKQTQALQSLHRALVTIRSMGYEGAAGAELADLLDWTELLPLYLSSDHDQTTDFREALAAMAEKDSRLSPALAVFDRAAPVPDRLARTSH